MRARSSGELSPRVRSLVTAPALAATVTLLLTGCSDASADEREERERKSATTGPSTTPVGPSASPASSAKPASLEQLAEAVGCAEPEVAGKALDYRQGVCKTAKAEYVLFTFDTASGQRDWLKVSQMYGGVYRTVDGTLPDRRRRDTRVEVAMTRPSS
ncbi:hypothetical protein OG762_20010 [Streptomyces sp. NBC_01136]|uniref:hypothetical protein n=1 Tax=unclassified Streptomyces TaxID=2593676 RepID=UPI0032563999|nr:hypothetical protein OG762_20010 [Streptomyces sp. NBC_01136]